MAANSYTVMRTKGGLRTMYSPYNNIIIGQLVKHNFPRRRSHFFPFRYSKTAIIISYNNYYNRLSAQKPFKSTYRLTFIYTQWG